MQAEGRGQLMYKNGFDCFKVILREEGVAGLFRGLSANLLRGSCFFFVFFISQKKTNFEHAPLFVL